MQAVWLPESTPDSLLFEYHLDIVQDKKTLLKAILIKTV